MSDIIRRHALGLYRQSARRLKNSLESICCGALGVEFLLESGQKEVRIWKTLRNQGLDSAGPLVTSGCSQLEARTRIGFKEGTIRSLRSSVHWKSAYSPLCRKHLDDERG